MKNMDDSERIMLKMKREKSITRRLGFIIMGILVMCMLIIFISMYRTNYVEVKKAAGVEAFGCANITTALIDPSDIEKIKEGDTQLAKTVGEDINWTIQHKGIFEGQYVLDLEGELLAVDDNLMEQGFDVGDPFHMSDDDLERLEITKAPVYSEVYEFGGMKRLTGYAPIFKDHDPEQEIIAISAIDFEASILHTRTWDMIKGGVLFAVIPLLLVGAVTILLINRTIKPLHDVSQFASRVAEGDLTVKPLDIKHNDEIGKLSVDLNTMAENLKSVIGDVAANASQLAGTTQEVTASTEEIAATAEQNLVTYQSVQTGAEEQLSIVHRTNEVLQTISAEAIQMNEKSQHLQETSLYSSEKADQGDKLIANSMQQMEKMNEESAYLMESMNELRDKSTEIDNIITMITQIAEQTNLLALNASIEAAHAGEQGKGFAVVAQEIRRLAEQSTEATHQISDLIHDIQDGTLEAANRTNTSMETVKSGSTIIEEAGKSFDEIKGSVNEVMYDINAMSTNMEKITGEVENIVQSMGHIEGISTRNVDGATNVMSLSEEQTAGIQEMTASMEMLSKMAEVLNKRTQEFKIPTIVSKE